MKDYCEGIAGLWLKLNPHMTVQGCSIDESGTVTLRLWISRSRKQVPLEIIMGNPASQVLATLRNALNVEARTKRLMKATGSRVIEAEIPSRNKDKID